MNVRLLVLLNAVLFGYWLRIVLDGDASWLDWTVLILNGFAVMLWLVRVWLVGGRKP